MPGTYHLYSVGFTGGFIGLRFENINDASQPSDDTFYAITDNTTWELSDVSGKDWQYDKDDYKPYSYFYKQGRLTYNEDFQGSTLAFAGEYPIKDSAYAQNGTLRFYTYTDGVVRISFSDTGSSASPGAYRRYLAVNGQRTDYWVSRANNSADGGYPEHLTETSGLIPVKAGYVHINGLKEDGTTSAPLRISKIEFFKITDGDPGAGGNSLVGVTDDTFSQRIYYYENGKSVSKWTYGGFKQTTHGLCGGVDDNGILYFSSDYYDKLENPDSDDDNTNGNITFYAPGNGESNYWLSCAYGSTIYVPVNAGTTGTITITCSQDDYKDGTGSDRYFELQKEGSSNVIKKLGMLKTSSLNYSADDISTYNGKTYLKLVSHYDKSIGYVNGYRYKGEMKVYTIAVAMDRHNSIDTDYAVEYPETDYDHDIGEDHTHAVFNWTQGTVYTQGYHYGTLTMRNGAVLTGANPDAAGASSGTETIHSYRNGDIVKYKTNYYGGLQLLSGENTIYTITPPQGYYITTSVRIHGHYNKNVSGTDDDGLGHNTFISSFGGGVFESFEENERDDSYMRFPRDDANARTTTLDFTVPASESIDFQVSGYQIFGIVDAVLVPKEVVPSLQGKLFYNYETDRFDLNELDNLQYGGTINYTPQEDEELWWYFVPENSEYKSRGRVDYINSDESHDPFDSNDNGVKDQNITKTFSVKNYKFVNATGSYDAKDDLEQNVYDIESNFKSSNQSAISMMADEPNESPSPEGSVSLTVSLPGTYYFYIHNKNTKYNSILGSKIFDTLDGVKDIEDTYETDESDAPMYNVCGQRVDSNYKGIVISNGRKYIRK